MKNYKHSELVIGLLIVMFAFVNANSDFYLDTNFVIYAVIRLILCLSIPLTFLIFVMLKVNSRSDTFFRMVFGNLILAFLATLLYYFLINMVARSFDFKSFDPHEFYFFYSYFIINTLIIDYYFSLLEKRRIENAKNDIKKQLSHLKINILKYQIHPHFFYNTLNNICGLIDIDTRLAKNTLSDFADFLKDVNLMKDANLLPISLEINVLKKYINIMKVRYLNRLSVDIDYDNTLKDILIPSLILQPIIENSLQYGFIDSVSVQHIIISINRQDDKLLITVENNGKLLNENVVFGKGLQNTKERLHSLFDDEFILKIQNKKNNEGVETIISFPVTQI